MRDLFLLILYRLDCYLWAFFNSPLINKNNHKFSLSLSLSLTHNIADIAMMPYAGQTGNTHNTELCHREYNRLCSSHQHAERPVFGLIYNFQFIESTETNAIPTHQITNKQKIDCAEMPSDQF